MWRGAQLDRALKMSDEEVTRTMSEPTPPVKVAAAPRAGDGKIAGEQRVKKKGRSGCSGPFASRGC